MKKVLLLITGVALWFSVTPLDGLYAHQQDGQGDLVEPEVCVFVDADHPVSEQEAMGRVKKAFEKAPLPLLIRFEGPTKLCLSNYLHPSDEDKKRLDAISCPHHGARMVISALEATEAFEWKKKTFGTTKGPAAITYSIHLSIVFRSDHFDDAVLHEWGHQVLGNYYPDHSPDPKSRMFKESRKGQIWTPEDIKGIRERLRPASLPHRPTSLRVITDQNGNLAYFKAI